MVDFLFIEGLPLDFFNPRSVVTFICILQGAVFSGLLFFRYFKQRKRADFWLAMLLVLLCSSLITPFIGFANVYDRNQWLTYFPFQISYGYSVCVWFYVLSLTNSKHKLTAKDWLLFVPALVYLIFRLTLFTQNLEFKNWFNENYYLPIVNPIVFVSEFVWNLIFLSLSLKHYKKYRKWLDENYSDTEKIKFDWLRNFLYIFTFVFILSGIFDFTDSFLFNLSYIQYFYFQLILALVTYYLAIAGYLLSETIEITFESTPQALESSQTAEVSPRKSLLTESELAKLKCRLQSLMTSQKPFLNSQLTLNDLSRQLGVNSTVLSYVINSGFNKNFNDFVNEHRINEVKEKLNTEAAEKSPLLGIAFDCGFNSKATFNRAFKKFADVSPKEFQEKIKQTSFKS